MIRLNRHCPLLAFGVVFAIVAAISACTNTCSTGAICGDSNVIGPSANPSATPLPSPGATPDPCLVKSLTAGFHSGAQLPFLALGAIEQLDATAFNDSGEVAKGCNVSREPLWTVLTPTTCMVLGSGWNPFVKGLRVGSCGLVASIVSDNRTVNSNPFTVEVR